MKATMLLLCLSLLSLVTCTAIQDAANPPGTLHPNGTIERCHGWESDQQACGNAIHNAKVINQVELGQSKEEVRAIMKHDPERRTAGDGREQWHFITNYGREINTVIIFEGDKVVGIEEAAWGQVE